MTTSRKSFDSRKTWSRILTDLRNEAAYDTHHSGDASGALASEPRAAHARLTLAADDLSPTRRPNRLRRLLGRLGGPGGARLTVRRLR